VRLYVHLEDESLQPSPKDGDGKDCAGPYPPPRKEATDQEETGPRVFVLVETAGAGSFEPVAARLPETVATSRRRLLAKPDQSFVVYLLGAASRSDVGNLVHMLEIAGGWHSSFRDVEHCV